MIRELGGVVEQTKAQGGSVFDATGPAPLQLPV